LRLKPDFAGAQDAREVLATLNAGGAGQ